MASMRRLHADLERAEGAALSSAQLLAGTASHIVPFPRSRSASADRASGSWRKAKRWRITSETSRRVFASEQYDSP